MGERVTVEGTVENVLGVYLLIGRVWNSGKQRGRKRESRI